MTADSIRAGFEHLRSEQEMRPLADAARSRAESDWLVGINATRALTSFNSRSGGFQMTAAGRVRHRRWRSWLAVKKNPGIQATAIFRSSC